MWNLWCYRWKGPATTRFPCYVLDIFPAIARQSRPKYLTKSRDVLSKGASVTINSGTLSPWQKLSTDIRFPKLRSKDKEKAERMSWFKVILISERSSFFLHPFTFFLPSYLSFPSRESGYFVMGLHNGPSGLASASPKSKTPTTSCDFSCFVRHQDSMNDLSMKIYEGFANATRSSFWQYVRWHRSWTVSLAWRYVGTPDTYKLSLLIESKKKARRYVQAKAVVHDDHW